MVEVLRIVSVIEVPGGYPAAWGWVETVQYRLNLKNQDGEERHFLGSLGCTMLRTLLYTNVGVMLRVRYTLTEDKWIFNPNRVEVYGYGKDGTKDWYLIRKGNTRPKPVITAAFPQNLVERNH